MKPLFLILFLLVYRQSAIGQTTEEQIKLPTPRGDLKCFYKPKYSVPQRNQFYPFNIADTIKLISFRYHKNNYPVKGDSVLTDSLVAVKILTKQEVNKLTDILYNNFYKRNPNYGVLMQCFFPRNAILFLNSFGHLKENVLLCFHCDRHEASSDEINFGNECSQKMEKLRQFFVSIGLKFGTDKSVDLYPGERDGLAPIAQPISTIGNELKRR